MRPEPRNLPHIRLGLGLLAVLAVLASLLVAAPAAADDKELFKESTASPYVFFLLDVSGSMNQSIPCSVEQALAGNCGGPPCTQQQIDDGLCPVLCPNGACLPRAIGDDPFSRLRTAKEAIYEIADEVDDIQFGFGQFGRSNLQVSEKHWWYRPLVTQPSSASLTTGFITLESGRLFPDPRPDSDDGIAGHEDIFGDIEWECDTFSKDGGRSHQCEFDGYDCDDDRFVGCRDSSPADLDNAWEHEKIRRIPKLDDDNSDARSDADKDFFIRDTDGAVYRVIYQNVSGLTLTEALDLGVRRDPVMGDPRVPARIQVRCVSGCSRFTDTESYVVFEKAGEMVYWEPGEGVRRDPPGEAFFGPNARQASVGNSGLEGNGDSDAVDGINLMVETIDDPDGRGSAFSVGDLIPFDWKRNRTFELKARMAPNVLLPGQQIRPDFRIASYLTDHDENSGQLAPRDPEDYLRAYGLNVAADRYRDELSSAEKEAVRKFFKPVIARSGTPTGSAVNGFKSWLEDWLAVATDPNDGDPNIECRKIYLVILTDGLASDGKTACSRAQELRSITVNNIEFDVRTFGVAFGRFAEDFEQEKIVTGRDNMLECIADDGGTDVDDDLDGDGTADGPGVLFPQNKEELVSRLREVIQLLRPEPRTLTGVAVPSVQAEAADKVFLTDFTPLNSRPIWPGKVHAFVKPLPLDADSRPDFGEECADLGPDDPLSACYLYEVGEELRKQAELGSGDPVGNGTNQRRLYVSLFQDVGRSAGDTVPRQRRFLDLVDDSTPLADELDLLSGFDATDRADLNQAIQEILRVKQATLPDGSTVRYVLGDVFHSDPLLVGSPPNTAYFRQDSRYRDFFAQHQTRRRTLFVASNDGFLHAFDVGGWVRDSDRPAGGFFDNGSGREMFAYMPRPVMETVHEMFDENRHHFTVDGQLVAGDVFIDPEHSAQLSDPPEPDDRIWRTVLVNGLRRGGGRPADFELPALPSTLPSDPVERAEAVEEIDAQEVSGYYALDITQPDPVFLVDVDPDPQAVEEVPMAFPPSGRQPGCAGDADGSNLANGCDSVAYGTPLWEFSDTFNGILLDEDGDGLGDLGYTWSAANMGRMKVCTANCGVDGAEIEDRYVAVFGGGLDPERPERGHWLYIVDVETGLAIYKQPLDGAAPAQPAAVDLDLDGYLDRIYVGTTEGFMYRVDLKRVESNELVFPPLLEVSNPIVVTGRSDNDGDGSPDSYQWTPKRITDSRFAPVKLFDVNADDNDVRSIFFRPSVFFVPEVGHYALAFGTGNREDIFERNEPTVRFFTLVDDIADPSALLTLPLGPDDLKQVDLNSSATSESTNLLINPPVDKFGGWWLEGTVDERLITEPFALAGVLVFSTFEPTGVSTAAALCQETGQSRIYGVFSTNGNGLLFDGTDRTRYTVQADFVTSPFTEQAQTKNPPRSNSGQRTADQLDSTLVDIMNELRETFPPTCRFHDGYRIDIKARSSDTGMLFIAPVPICIIEKNYSENPQGGS